MANNVNPKTKEVTKVLPHNLTVDQLIEELNHSAQGEQFKYLTESPECNGSSVKAELDLRVERLNTELRVKQYNELVTSDEPMVELFRRYNYPVASVKTNTNAKTKQVTYEYIPDTSEDARHIAFNIPDFIKWANDEKSVKVDRTSAHKVYLELVARDLTIQTAQRVKAKCPKIELSTSAQRLVNDNGVIDTERLASWAITSLVPSDKNNNHISFSFNKEDIEFVLIGATKHASKYANRVQVVKPAKLYNSILRVAHCKVCGLPYEIDG